MKLIIDIPKDMYKDVNILIVKDFPELKKAIANGTPLGDKEERLQGRWIIMRGEQGALGITYKIRKCSKCGWEHSLVIPNNFCPNCGADMQGDT